MKNLLIGKILLYVLLKGRVEIMKNFKRVLAIFLAALMFCVAFGCSAETTTKEQPTTEAPTTEAPTTEAPTTETPTTEAPTEAVITVNLHYVREDAAYEGWDLWTWVGSSAGVATEFSTEAGDRGVVATVTVPVGTESMGFIVRTPDWANKDYPEDQFIDLTGVEAGTFDVYVVSGVAGYTTE